MVSRHVPSIPDERQELDSTKNLERESLMWRINKILDLEANSECVPKDTPSQSPWSFNDYGYAGYVVFQNSFPW